MKQLVQQSDLNIYFDDLTEELPIWELDEDEARRLWRETFDARSTVFFNLPDDSWVETERGVDIGDWRPCLNEEDFEPFRQSLSAGVPWRAQDEVLFAATCATILQTTWEAFLRYWPGFLYLRSDAPILLSPQHPRQCVLFFPGGRTLFIDASQSK